MIKNADSKSGYRRRTSQRFQMGKTSFTGKENLFPSNMTDQKNRSLRGLSKRKTDRVKPLNSKRDIHKRKTLQSIQSRAKRKNCLQNLNQNKSKTRRKIEKSCFDTLMINSSKRRKSKAENKENRNKIGRNKKSGRSELTYTRKSSQAKGGNKKKLSYPMKRRINKNKKENIYDSKLMKDSKQKTKGNESIYEKQINQKMQIGDWNYQSMKNVFKANSSDLGTKLHLLKSQNFQTLNPTLRNQEVKKRIQRPSISKLDKFSHLKNSKGMGSKISIECQKNVDIRDQKKKMYNKIFSKKEIETFVRVNSNKCSRIHTEIQNDKVRNGRKNNLDEFFKNLELRSEKQLIPRPGSNLINHVGKIMKNSELRNSSKQNDKIESLTSLIRNSNKTFESIEKMMLESKNKKKSMNIFETIYKDKARPNSKNNNRRRKSSRMSGKSNGLIWGNGNKRDDSSRNFRKISKWIKNDKSFHTRTEGLDIENSLYCKENLKKMGQNQEFNVPCHPAKRKIENQPSTMDRKNTKNNQYVNTVKTNQIEVKISSFFKESRNNSEKALRNPKAIKEETPEIQKKRVNLGIQTNLIIPKTKNNFSNLEEIYPYQSKSQKEKIQDKYNEKENNKLDIENDENDTERSNNNHKLLIESPTSKSDQTPKGFFPKIPDNFQYKNNFKDILAHHIDKIFSHLKIRESKCLIKEDYFKKKQKQVDPKMREVLIDWLIEVHNRYKMRHETIFLATRLIDKYLSVKPIEYDRFQLLGTASLMISAKYEEIYPPKVKDFVYICANAYSRSDVLEMEAKILRIVNFDLVFPTSIQFFGFFQKIFSFESTIKNLTYYILYGSLISQNFTQKNPRLLAYSAIIMANKAFKNYDGIKKFKNCIPGDFKDSEVNLCIFQIYNMLLSMKKSELSALRTKFSSEKFGNIAQIQQRVH